MSTDVASSTACAPRPCIWAALAGATCGGGASSDARGRPNVIRSPAPSASAATAPTAIAFPPRFFAGLETEFGDLSSVLRTIVVSELCPSDFVLSDRELGELGELDELGELGDEYGLPGTNVGVVSLGRSDRVISARSGFRSERASNDGGSRVT